MSSLAKIRFQHRFENFSKAVKQLQDACEKDSYSNLELAGLIQTFMFSYELAWKVLKDLLQHDGYPLNSPRAVIRQSFVSAYLNEQDTEIFLEALLQRNKLSQMHDIALIKEDAILIKEKFQPMLSRLHQTLSNTQFT